MIFFERYKINQSSFYFLSLILKGSVMNSPSLYLVSFKALSNSQAQKSVSYSLGVRFIQNSGDKVEPFENSGNEVEPSLEPNLRLQNSNLKLKRIEALYLLEIFDEIKISSFSEVEKNSERFIEMIDEILGKVLRDNLSLREEAEIIRELNQTQIEIGAQYPNDDPEIIRIYSELLFDLMRNSDQVSIHSLRRIEVRPHHEDSRIKDEIKRIRLRINELNLENLSKGKGFPTHDEVLRYPLNDSDLNYTLNHSILDLNQELVFETLGDFQGAFYEGDKASHSKFDEAQAEVSSSLIRAFREGGLLELLIEALKDIT